MVILIIFSSVFVVLILFLNSGWHKIREHKNAQFGEAFISVLIPARNEQYNIGELLKEIIAQDYPANLYEIIVIDDNSTDKTAEIARSYGVKVILLSDYVFGNINSYKKKALEIAVSECKGNIIVTTDADCSVRPKWLSEISSFYKINDPDLVLMPVVFRRKNNFLNLFQFLDFMSLQAVTAATAGLNIPVMANGANLSFKKTAFLNSGGYSQSQNIASGDDMFFLHSISKNRNNKISYLKSKNVIVTTDACPTIKSFLNQRIRWASKSSSYKKWNIKLLLAFIYLYNFLVLSAGIYIFCFHNKTNFHLITFLVCFAAKIFIEIIFLIPVAKFFNSLITLWLLPFFEPLHILYTVALGFLSFKKTYVWKGRKVS